MTRRASGAGWRCALAFAGLGVWLSGCGQEAPPEPSAPSVAVAPVAVRILEERIEASGELVARQQARVAAEVGGRITEIMRDEGSEVEAREIVLEIDPARRKLAVDDARAGLVRARASLAEARRESKRIEALHARGVASEARRDQATTQLRLAEAEAVAGEARLGVAERALADASVRAPFAGVVSLRLVSAGEFVQPGTPLFDLVALDPVDAEFRLPEADAARVAPGQDVAVGVAPYPDEVFPAVVRFVSPTIDPDTRTLLVRAALDNADHRLRPGLFARVDLGVSRRDGVVMIPEEAVLQRADGQVVFRLVDGSRVERRSVETGQHADGEVEVRGLEVRDRVVVRGQHLLTDGVRVSVRTPDGRPAADRAEAAVGEGPQ